MADNVERLDKHMKKLGSVTIVGGGISGIQTALDIANADYKVYLVEETPSVGGVMAQLDKTFPTNDCSSCMMGPKLVELANHPNIEILAYTDFLDLKGEPGNFKVSVKKKARYVDPDKCVGCGICAEKCPTKVPDVFNLGINKRKAIYVPYPQAVPLIYTIDTDYCRRFVKGKCGICQKFCENNAIDYDQQDEIVEFDTGAVILAGGFEPFDAAKKGAYGHGLWPNVVTSLEYERILSAAGPFQGHIQRISDGKSPKKIAWIQCVGSRDSHFGQDYCSAVCCMYATKQAMITKEHEDDVDTAIFYIDIRAQGKGFDRFYERSKSENGVRYVRSMISRVIPNPEDDTLRISYVTPTHEIAEETFDMIVLSIGLCSNPSAVRAAKQLGLEIDDHGFIVTDPLDVVSTSRDGVYVCGVSQGPKDIPDSVQQGSSAAAKATALLADARGTLVETPELPEERDITGEVPRIGVFICHCGINIAGVVDVAAVAEYAGTLADVEYASHCMFACSTDMQQEIKREIEEHQLNRVLVASCTPRTHEPLFRNTLREAGLNPYLFELANIREQDSWVHQSEPEKATDKAKDLVRMSVSRIRLLQPLYDASYAVVQSALVVGGGLAGLTAAISTAEQGFPAVLVEKSAELGGNARTLYYTEDGANPAEYVLDLIEKVESHPLITVYTEAEVTGITGACGNFTTTLAVGGSTRDVDHGVVFVATGAEEYKPEEYYYGKTQKVMTQKEFEKFLATSPEQAKKINSVAMIQCVGSREPEHMYCSRVCCTAAIKNSLKFKSLNRSAQVSVLYRDIRTFGLKESYYTEARKQGVRFYRYDLDHKPSVTPVGDWMNVVFIDQQLQTQVLLKSEIVVLSAAIRPRQEGRQFAEVSRLPLEEDGFFMEAHIKLRPLDFANAGYFLCGLAHGPKFANESIVQARGAVSRALTVLAKKELKAEAVINHVDANLCRACGECERTCSFEAIKVQEVDGRQQAVVNEALCTGCGACNVACPTGAASLAHFQDEQVNAMIEAFL
jgi:heterodisulfide reductase subunit A2